jgi:PTH1 family peptidyl-tRNA hydrolase
LGAGQKPHADFDTADWVLSDMSKAELKLLKDTCETACEAIELIVRGEIELAMGKYNG